MFVGHYGVSFAGRGSMAQSGSECSLWPFRFLDVLWAPFILFGIDTVRLVPGMTASNPFDL